MENARRYIKNTFPRVFETVRTLVEVVRGTRSRPVATPMGFSLVGDQSMEMGTFEPDETKLLLRLLPNTRVFVDVGANVGYYACLARSQGCKVIAIEPLQTNLKRLLTNLSLNGWGDTQVIPLGMSDTTGIVEIHGGGTGASLVGGWAGVTPLNKQLISVAPLDSFVNLSNTEGNVLVKIDVEGAELTVLRGAQKLLSRRPYPTWLVEICLTEHHPSGLNPNFLQTFETFWQSGYESFTADEANRPVLREDVQEWITARRRSFGSHNFLFRRSP